MCVSFFYCFVFVHYLDVFDVLSNKFVHKFLLIVYFHVLLFIRTVSCLHHFCYIYGFSLKFTTASKYQHDNELFSFSKGELACVGLSSNFPTRASEEKKKMIRQTSVHSLKKLFDMGLLGLTGVVFGCRRFGAAGQQKPPVDDMQELLGWQDDMPPPGNKHILYAVSEQRDV